MDWPNDKVPTRWQLDEIAPNHPVYITRGPHTYLLNSLALRLAGIDRNTPDPEGGWIFRDANGEPNGRVLEAARRLVDRVIPESATPARTAEDGMASMRVSLGQLMALGITSVNISGIRPTGVQAIRDLWTRYGEELPRATMQVRLSPGHDTYDDGEEGIGTEIAALEALDFKTGDGDDRFKIGAIKMSIDGGLSAPVFWSLEPYEGRPDFFGAIRIPDDIFYPVAKRAHELGWQLGIHAMGDGAVKMVTEQMARILDEDPRDDHRHFMHHVAVKPPQETIELMAEHGIMVASQPAFTVGLGAYAREALNDDRNATQNPTKSLQNAGVVVSHGSDSAPYGPLITIWTATTRIGFDGQVHGPEEAVSLEEAIRLHTRAPAYFNFDEEKKGAILAGMYADFILLSDDILSVAPEAIRDLTVTRTFVGGREIVR
jgi:predicted amidohydrolase YtcJ